MRQTQTEADTGRETDRKKQKQRQRQTADMKAEERGDRCLVIIIDSCAKISDESWRWYPISR